jgi:hypothetical protein
MYTVYDRIVGDVPAKNTLYTPYIYVGFWPTLGICHYSFFLEKYKNIIILKTGARWLKQGSDRLTPGIDAACCNQTCGLQRHLRSKKSKLHSKWTCGLRIINVLACTVTYTAVKRARRVPAAVMEAR